jgi:hypothetical protein
MLKPYLVFAGPRYYASGGMWDFQRDFDTLDEAVEWVRKDQLSAMNYNDWYQIYDQQTRGFLNDMDGAGHA